MRLPKSWVREGGKIIPVGCGAVILNFLQQSENGLRDEEIYHHLRQQHYTGRGTMRVSLRFLEIAGFVQNSDNRYTLRPEGSEVKVSLKLFEEERKSVPRLKQSSW